MPRTGKPSSKAVARPVRPDILGDLVALTAALNRALHDALDIHRRLGRSVPAWRKGRVVWVGPDEMQLDHLVPKAASPPGRTRRGQRKASRKSRA